MESALYGIYPLVVFVSEILLVSWKLKLLNFLTDSVLISFTFSGKEVHNKGPL